MVRIHGSGRNIPKAYSASGKYKSALEQFRKGSDIIGSDKTYDFYLREVEQQKKEQEEHVYVPAQFSTTINESFPGSTQPAVSESGGFESYENLISETLAKIYLTQGEREEALKVYEKLIKKHPLKKLYYEAKILDIKSGIK
jgi:tetratricopeptide (TPR) repeat protein